MILDGRTLALIVGYTARLIVLRHFLLRARPPAANDNRRGGRVRRNPPPSWTEPRDPF